MASKFQKMLHAIEDICMKNILVTRPSMPSAEEYFNEIRGLWDSMWLTNMGEKHKEFQNGLKNYLGVEQVDLLTNGHMALELSLQALQLRGEVITTPFTFASTIHAIVRNGLKPVFCDINTVDFTIDVDKIESLITDRTVAILPVHVYGNICDVERIDEIAKKYGLKVIYDAAHAFGETLNGVGVGAFGDISCFSFHATKVFNSIEGGAACYSDEEFGRRLYNLKNFGIRGPECVEAVGANAKMNEFCAAMGICNLRHIEEEISKREVRVRKYTSELENVDGLKLNCTREGVKSNYSYYPIFIDKDKFGCDRDEIFDILEKNGYGARKYFYPLANEYDCYKQEYDVSDTPIAKKISEQVLTIPLYSDLPIDDVEHISDIIRNCKK